MKGPIGYKLILGMVCMVLTRCASYSQVDINQADCYNDRKNTDTILNAQAEIQKIAQTYCIVVKEAHKRYVACNLPDTLQHENTPIIFSGYVKEIFPNERLVGTPFLLTEVKLDK